MFFEYFLIQGRPDLLLGSESQKNITVSLLLGSGLSIGRSIFFFYKLVKRLSLGWKTLIKHLKDEKVLLSQILFEGGGHVYEFNSEMIFK